MIIKLASSVFLDKGNICYMCTILFGKIKPVVQIARAFDRYPVSSKSDQC